MPTYNRIREKGLLSAAVIMIAVFVLCVGSAYSGGEQPAPDFLLRDLNGRMHNLSDYRGKVVVLNFWASWCKECVNELPSLNFLYEQMKGRDVIILGVSIDRSETTARETASREKIPYPVLLDKKGEVFVKKFTVVGLPNTFLIDRKGVVREILRGRTHFVSTPVIDKIQAILDKKI